MSRRAGVLGLTVCTSALGVLPIFMVGALAVQLEDDLGMDSVLVGAGTSLAFLTSSLLARLVGSSVDRLGSSRSMSIACALAAIALLGIGASFHPAMILAFLVVSGIATAFAQPASNVFVWEALPSGRLGLALGIKQSSVPAATFIGGMTVPLAAEGIGWRGVLALTSVLAVCVLVWSERAAQALRGRPRPPRAPMVAPPVRTSLVALTVAGGLASAVSTAAGVFTVLSGVNAGISLSTVGVILAVGSIVGAGVRIGWGIVADRFPRIDLCLLIAALLVGGSAGTALMSVANLAAFTVGVLLIFTCGWAWAGLIHLLIVRENPDGVGGATGFVQTGLAMGGAVGPLSFGIVARFTSYDVSWLGCAALGLLGAACLLRASAVRRRREATLFAAGC